MKSGIHNDNNDNNNVTVMSPDELDIKDEDMEKIKVPETQEVTLDVTGTIYYKKTPGSTTAIVSFVLSDVPVNTPEENIKGYAVNALHDALLKEAVIKCRVGSNIMLQVTDDISRILIESVTIRKGE
ncbi:MAG: hypothetical protein IKQ22_00915 [Clostridia bacterium]|nr:hypothetical protein [Clostridia bacterium]